MCQTRTPTCASTIERMNHKSISRSALRSKPMSHESMSDRSSSKAGLTAGSTASKRSIRFSRLAKVYCIPALSELSREEISAMWTTDKDLHQAQADVVSVIRALRSGNASSLVGDDGPICSRGLEHMMTPERMERRQRKKERVYDAVLDAQFEQTDRGVAPHHEAIAAASEEHSQWAKDVALALGTSDAEYVKQHVCLPLEDTRDEEEGQDEQEEEEEEEDGGLLYCKLMRAINLSSETCSDDDKAKRNAKKVTKSTQSPIRHHASCWIPKGKQETSTPKLPKSCLKESQSSLRDCLSKSRGSKVLNRFYQEESQRSSTRYMLNNDMPHRSIRAATSA